MYTSTLGIRVVQIKLSPPKNQTDTQKGKNTARWGKKKSVPSAMKTISTSSIVIYTVAVCIISGREFSPLYRPA